MSKFPLVQEIAQMEMIYQAVDRLAVPMPRRGQQKETLIAIAAAIRKTKDLARDTAASRL